MSEYTTEEIAHKDGGCSIIKKYKDMVLDRIIIHQNGNSYHVHWAPAMDGGATYSRTMMSREDALERCREIQKKSTGDIKHDGNMRVL